MNATVLHGLDAVSDLNDLARGGVRICIGAGLDVVGAPRSNSKGAKYRRQRRGILAQIRTAVPNTLPTQIRDDVIGSMALEIVEGKTSIDGHSKARSGIRCCSISAV
jgi:hypothetical protein